ncbi:DUF1697 domain-containing protein [Rhodococcus sp. HNM0569]|uniref:DUF1697 domain-containing protein n=1 Tax=Rhodococcus sp. HNM0569 TaxID=2716340 RepID=UPI00146C7069|nr:DUF1697 domain-containing protein [Rhodococcus sp. HNM0569]NLU82845.1 DUF1697 domain-containing protein [Rhodococcus sp. HNM0569]
MSRFVALLRGVNVGGVTVRMAPLREVFESGLGFGSVRTVLASGNVVFDAEAGDAAALRRAIEDALRREFGYDARVFVLPHDVLSRIRAGYPFDDPAAADRNPYVVLVDDADALDSLAATAASLDPTVERVAAGEGVVYWEVTKGSTTSSRFGKALAARKLAPVVTTRNLRTLDKLLV